MVSQEITTIKQDIADLQRELESAEYRKARVIIEVKKLNAEKKTDEKDTDKPDPDTEQH